MIILITLRISDFKFRIDVYNSQFCQFATHNLKTMAINKNHEVEELEGVRCAIVERNVSPARTQFLKELLEMNGYKVITAKTPPPKVAAPPAAPVSQDPNAPAPPPPPPPPPPPDTYTVGVTNITFNSTNAIMGRLLHAKDGHVVTLAYWQQKDDVARDDVPYFSE